MRLSAVPVLLAAGLCAAQGDIASLLQSQSDLSTLLHLVGQIDGLADLLGKSSNITIFAPTNAAFESVPADSPEGQAVANGDTTGIAALLSNHVFQGRYPASAVTNTPAFIQSLCNTTFHSGSLPLCGVSSGQYAEVVLNGDKVSVISGQQAISTVTQANITLGDGIIIHKVDAALRFSTGLQQFTERSNLTFFDAAIQVAGLNTDIGITESSNGTTSITDFTIFVPNNEAFENIGSVLASADQETLQKVLGYHIIPGNIVFSTDLNNITVPSAQVANLTFTVLPDGSAWVNGAKIIFPNALLYNGVAHVIDVVLNPLTAPFNRDTLKPEANAADRVAFENATTATSLPFTASTQTASYTTSQLLQTVAAVPTSVAPGVSSVAPSGTSGGPAPSATNAAGMLRCDLALGFTIAIGLVLGTF